MREPEIDIANEEAAMDELKSRDVLISNEFKCCDDLPMLVQMPETLTCQVCGKSYMELMRGVQHPFVGVLTVDKVYK
jgi:hypothetical protein